MVKKVKVKLFGTQNRHVIVDSEATEGAMVGRDLRWPDGSVVQETEVRGGTTTTTPDPSTPTVTLWELILGIPKLIQQLAALVAPGYIYHDGTDLSAHEHPLHDVRVEVDETLIIPANKQYILWQSIEVLGTLEIETGGELVLLDEPLPEPTGPDFTWVSGDLTQIDYDGGEQKIFTYNVGGDLTRVDYIRDGLTLRKDLVWVSGELDYIDEYYV